MKITRIDPVVVNAEMRNWVFVRVETDQPGLIGWGEATLEWKTRAVVGAIEDVACLLIGEDPANTEHLYRVMKKHSFWRMGAIGNSTISGIEIALFDILGKSLGVPVWQLLGGKVRDRVRLYAHLGLGDMRAVYGSGDPTEAIERATDVIERGYRALKVLCLPYSHFTATPREVDRVANLAGRLRETVGDDIDLMFDFHGRPASLSLARAYVEAVSVARPMFVEEPLPPGDCTSLALLSHTSPVPIAAGERLVERNEFDELIRTRAVSFIQPDICHCGGLGEAKKLAAMAEVASVGVAPHNPLGPIASAAALHFAVSTPNHVIQEEMTGAVPWFDEVVTEPLQRDGGYWTVPTKPGLGVDVNEDACARHPFAQEVVLPREAILADGTIVDW